MRQNVTKYPDSASDIANYFSKASAPTQQETLGQIVVEILRAGKILNRKAICTRLLRRLEVAANQEEELHYQTLIGMLFER
ncbi:regulatory protein YcgZ [Candidatus Pantoea multigeneris]|uniref:Two-component-system connector protein YcgZ n=1 Tax=Candidatus Pantoea multigeneris TaxID=2608357 RepID=A0ABX0RF58_9GAMM|nr:regulatory protein YcgZ [Pantoea multigeneris]NIF23978.1 two-component-system connector protein YcgZ [Pantoea multigeneris]